MASFERTESDRRCVQVPLPTRTRDEFEDVIANLGGGLPDSVVYQTRIPYSIAVGFEQADTSGQWMAEAWIDFPGDYAVIRLNGDLYADTPAEGLVEEAERMLEQWALSRRTLGQDTAPAPDVP